MNDINLGNPVLAVAMLTQEIAALEKKADVCKGKLSDCLKKRGAILMAMGDKQGAEDDMKRFLELNPEKVEELSGEFKAEGRENCR